MSTRLLRALARLVPDGRRGTWLEEWSAEHAYAEQRMRRARARRSARLTEWTWFTLQAAEDAMGIWVRSRGTSKLIQEFRVAARSLWRSPGFALVSILTLALGIGASTATFSILRSVVLRPLPFGDPDALVDVRLSFRNLETGAERLITASEPEFLEIRDESEALAGLGGYWASEANFGGGAEPERVPTASVSANFLPLLGVEPVLGRGFAPDEDLPGRSQVAILSHGLWTRAFGADPAVIGTESLVNGRPARIIGVLPQGFTFPGNPVDLLLPNVIDPAAPAGRSSHYMSMVGRLPPGVEIELAQERLDEMARRWEQESPGRHGVSPTHPLTLVPIRDAMVGDAPRMLFLLQGAVVLVLLIACANVAALMLVRAESRQHASGVRYALGGTRSDIAAPFLVESSILALLGTVVGLALTWGSLGLVARLGPEVLDRVGGVHVDAAVLLFAVASAVGSVMVFGLGPAVGASLGDVVRPLQHSGQRTTSSRARLAVRRAIVTAQTGLAVVLVVASGLLLKSFARLQSVDPGFDPSDVVTAQFTLSSGGYPDPDQVAAFHDALAERLAAMPGAVAAGSIRSLPFADGAGIETISPTDQPVDREDFWNAQYQVVGPGYFEALGIRLLEGRDLARSDGADAPGAVVVDEAMARLFWPGQSPIGRRFRHGVPESPTPELTVVGVVGNVRLNGYAGDVRPTFYVPHAQALAIYNGLGTRTASVVVRSALRTPDALANLRDVLRELDPDLPVNRLSAMPRVMRGSVADERFLALVVGAFTFLALALAAVGIGGVVAYTVARRTRELGLRIVLGADGASVIRGILSGAFMASAAGIGLGIVGAWVSGGILADQLFEVSPRDPLVLFVAPVALLLVSLLAAYLPARRAATVDPAVAIRGDGLGASG